MRKLTVDLKNQDYQEILLDRNIEIFPGDKLILGNAFVYWELENIIKDKNDEILKGISSEKFEPGFWSFSQFKEEFLQHNLELEKIVSSSKCKITNKSNNNINLKSLGRVLRFKKDQVISSGSSKGFDQKVDIYLGLSYVRIHCDLVERSKNVDTQGELSSVVTSLPITSTQTLNGSVSFFENVKSELELREGVYNKLGFWVDANKSSNDHLATFLGEILLEIYV